MDPCKLNKLDYCNLWVWPFWCKGPGWFEILVNYRVKFFLRILRLETVQNDATPLSWTAMMKLGFFWLPAWCQDNLWDGILALFVSQLGQMASWTVVKFRHRLNREKHPWFCKTDPKFVIHFSRWWFQNVFQMFWFPPLFGQKIPFWLTFFKWVETTK